MLVGEGPVHHSVAWFLWKLILSRLQGYVCNNCPLNKIVLYDRYVILIMGKAAVWEVHELLRITL